MWEMDMCESRISMYQVNLNNDVDAMKQLESKLVACD